MPTAVLFAVFAYLAHGVAKRDLEGEFGARVASVASAAATQIRGRHLVDLESGDEDDRAYQFNKRKLDVLVDQTGVARFYVIDREFRVKVASGGDTPLGSEHFYAQLHRAEIQQVFAGDGPQSTVLFEGNDGARYLAGYAPVRASEADPDVVLVLGVDAAPTHFERLADLRRTLLLYGVVLLVVVIAVSLAVAAMVTRPVRALVDAAEEIGHGQLDHPIERRSSDEIGFLADTMERMRRDLRARDEHMQMMLAGVAHEVRNPLGGMKLFTGILRDELAGDADSLAHVARLEKELTYLDNVVSQFVDYARRPEPELGDVDLAALADEIADLARAVATEREVEVAVDAEATRVRADRGQLRRALLNLVRNAVEHTDRGGRVHIRVSGAGERGVLEVTNSGEPIDPDIVDRIFEPFFTTREKGTGLGLAFAREIALDHGGNLTVARGEASTSFTLSVPKR